MIRYLITCEHATNFVPAALRPQIDRDFAQLLKTHRGFDEGALPVARAFAKYFSAPLIAGEVSRLVVDLNRTVTEPSAFSKLLPSLTARVKGSLIRRYHEPFRAKARRALVAELKTATQPVHLSIHSFTPIWNGHRRATEIGFLFDPSRINEVRFARTWMKNLKAISSLTVHANRPYRGTNDGHTTSLRKTFSPNSYLGIEIEMNQKILKTMGAVAIAQLLLKARPLDDERSNLEK